MSANIRSANIAIFTRCCWLAGFSLASVIRSCRKAGADDEEIANAVSIYIAGDNAMVRKPVIQQGAHLDRRAAS
ncbi:hypothetical protein [Mesorhizobium sp.]|uniref:hypothetical protein n=1 Tax=Mesorhizobium sp. TaxID=1871066 RepID=UPI0025E1D0CF|nr:hypothetical protein [Mesorhizobium sp.]